MKYKIATTITQSRKLVELGLDPKTADMYYPYLGAGQYGDIPRVGFPIEHSGGRDIPAWSLSALLEVMPKKETPYIMYLNEPPFDTEYRWQCGLFDYIGSPGSSPIEAASQMVCWLLENGYTCRPDQLTPVEKGGEQ